MSYSLDFSKQAKNDIDFHKNSGNKATVKKLYVLFNELTEHPYTGTGRPEQLKYDCSLHHVSPAVTRFLPIPRLRYACFTYIPSIYPIGLVFAP